MDILRVSSEVVYQEIQEAIVKPNPATALPPFIMLLADKATINRRTCQTILGVVTIDGEKVELPVGAPLVYEGTEGGTSAQLADQIIKTLQQNWQLPDSHLQMIAGLFFNV